MRRDVSGTSRLYLKALFDEGVPAGLTDGQLLEVHERPADDDWILVQSKDPAARNALVEVGYVPATYVEEVSSSEFVLNNGFLMKTILLPH